MTEVNQEPGPSTIQSASSTTSMDSGQAGVSCGIRRTEHTSPAVFATRACPRISETSSGLLGSSPITSAAMSSGTEAMGSTRPFAPRSLATDTSISAS